MDKEPDDETVDAAGNNTKQWGQQLVVPS